MKPKVLFIVPDGSGIKNYLFSNIIPYLYKRGAEVVVCHNLTSKAIHEVESIHNIKLIQKALPNFAESKIQKFHRESICYARLIYNAKLVNNNTILTNWNTNYKGKKKWFYKVVEIYGKRLSVNYNRILKAERKYQKLLLNSISDETQYLKKLNPTTVFCTHQRSNNALPMIKAANELGIKTVGAIYSWDNLPKARLTVRTKEYIVWSEYMKEEMELYYPEIERNKIHITGTPQFDFYKDESNSSVKEYFFKNYNLNINKKTICFSGDDEKTSPYDPIYLEDIAQVIIENNVEDNYQIIFRRSPVDLSSRYDAILNKYSNLIIPITPQWSNNNGEWTQLFPYIEDVKLLTNICKHSDLVINVGSTMAHDFACFQKPTAYINYNPKENGKWKIEEIYKYQHFRSIPNKNVVYWIDDKESAYKTIKESILSSKKVTNEWLKIINIGDIDISENIVNEILK